MPDGGGRGRRTRYGDRVRGLADRPGAEELQPNTVYNYSWLLGLVYPYVGWVRASRLSARMVERAYRELEKSGYSRSTLRTVDLVLAKAFGEKYPPHPGCSQAARERCPAIRVDLGRGSLLSPRPGGR